MDNAQRFRLRLPSISGSAIQAENLRKDPAGALMPVGEMPVTNILDGSVPVGTYRHPSGTVHSFRLNGSSLEITGDGDSSTLVALPGEYRCMVCLDNAVVIMTSEGPLRLSLTPSGWIVPRSSSALPPVAVEVDSTASFSGVTPAVNLRGEYPRWNGPLDTADAETLTRNIRALYDRLALTAAESGYFTQPVAVAFTVTDACGCRVAVSSPTVVSPHGLQGISPLTARAAQSGGSYASLSGFPMELKAFNLRLRIPGVTTQVLSFSDDSASVRFSTPEGNYTVSISVTPLSPLDRRGMARFSFSAAENTLTARQASAMHVFSTAFHPYRELGLPHSFTAATASTVGDMVVWGDIKQLSALPPAPSEIAASCAPAVAWTGMTRVTILHDDGSEEILSRTESGSSHAPRAINPYIGYIHPGATRLEIMVTDTGGSSRYLSLPLSPHPERKFSFYRAPSWLPVDIPLSSTVITPVTKRGTGGAFHGTVAGAMLSDPLNLLSSIRLASGRVTAITAASRSSGAWDFARRHLYVFSTAGIYAVAVNTSQSLMSAHIIDPSPVPSRDCVAETTQGVMAVSDGRLLSITGAKAQIVSPKFDASAIALNPAAGELWTLNDGEVTVMNLAKDAYRRTDIGAVDSILSAPGMLLLRRGSRYYDVTAENSTIGSRQVKWSVRIPAPAYTPSRVNRIKWVLNASQASVNLSVEGDNGSGHPHLIAREFVKGAVLAPLVISFPCMPVRYLTLTIEGTVSHDARLNSIFLE